MKLLKLVVVAAIIFSTINSNAQKAVKIFNGRTLDGWVNIGDEKWYVDKGKLICDHGPKKGEGYLATEKSYKNFELTFEFKKSSEIGNTGIFFYSTFVCTKVSGFQYEIDLRYDHTGGIYEPYARGWLAEVPQNRRKEILKGRWNHARIRVVNGHVTTWLNNERMVDDFYDEKIKERSGTGAIALQIHEVVDTRVMWKNIKIIELD